MPPKGKLALKTLVEECKALKDLDHGMSNKEVAESRLSEKISKSRYVELFKTSARYLEYPLSRAFAMSNFSVGPLGVRDNERRL